MPNSPAEILISRIGALSQLGSLVLITLLVGALARSRRDRGYFGFWALGWACYTVSLFAISFRFSGTTIDGVPLMHLPETTAVVFVINTIYSTGKLAFLVLLLAGTRLLVDPDGSRHRWHLLAFLPVPAALLVWLGGTLDRVMVAHCAVAVPIFVGCTVHLVRHARSHPSFGTTLLGGACGAHAVLWTLYGAAWVLAERQPHANPMGPLLSYNSYIDAVVQTVLAYGMALVVMEQATRESQLAHAELEVAHHALRKAAYEDSLTGCYNRHAFAEGIGLEDGGDPEATIVALDVDNLKAVNDTLGHEAGDALIAHLALALRGGLRPVDALYRWGGDEFLVVFPGLGLDATRQRVEQALAAAPSLAVGGVILPVRASAGFVPLRSRGELMAAIRNADRAMYEVKARRRSGALTDPALEGAIPA